jgi:Mycoplasma protein of unknown function, DUF285
MNMMMRGLARAFWTLTLLDATCLFIEAQNTTIALTDGVQNPSTDSETTFIDDQNTSSAVSGESEITPLTDESFRAALDLYKTDESTAIATYGAIETWDVSGVTNFSSLELPRTFQKDLSGWNVSSATDISEVGYRERDSFVHSSPMLTFSIGKFPRRCSSKPLPLLQTSVDGILARLRT